MKVSNSNIYIYYIYILYIIYIYIIYILYIRMMVVPFSNISMVPAAGIPTGDVLPCWAKAITPHPWPQVSDEGRCLGKRWWEEKNMIYIYIFVFIFIYIV